MDENNRLEVITQYGWQREYPLTKGIIHIGSAPTNDIRLDERFGGGVAPLQVQLITIANGKTVYKLINMGETDIAVGTEPENWLAPHSVLDLTDGLQFKLGEFTLVFHSSNTGRSAEADAAQPSRSIGLKLELPSSQLLPNRSLDGVVTVSNLGHQMGARFDLTLEGLEPDFYELAPGPLLSSGAEKEVFFRLHHRGHQPLAGSYRLTIRATAPETYPGEQATVSQIIEVLPYYQHGLSLAPAKGITPHRPVEQPQVKPASLNGVATTVVPESEATWDLPLKTKPVPVVTFNAAAPPPAKNGGQPHSQPVDEIDEPWWSGRDTPAEATEPAAEGEPGPDLEPDPPSLPLETAADGSSADTGMPSPTDEVLWEDELEPTWGRDIQPAQHLEVIVLPQTASTVLKEEEEQWWGTR